MNFDVPVAPFVGPILGQEDVVFSLVNLAPAESIRLKLPPERPKLVSATFRSVSTSLETLAELGITSAVTISNKFSGAVACFSVEMLATADVPNQYDEESDLITRATVGVGFRVAVIAFNFSNATKVDSPGAIAASATLGTTHSLFEVAVVGAGLEALPAVKPLIGASLSAFDMATYQTLGSVQVALNEYLVTNAAALTPAVLSVSIDASRVNQYAYPAGTGDFRADAEAQTFAFERAFHGSSLDNALADPRVKANRLNERIIRHVYSNYLELEPSDSPTSKAKDAASRVLHAGRW